MIRTWSDLACFLSYSALVVSFGYAALVAPDATAGGCAIIIASCVAGAVALITEHKEFPCIRS